MAGNKGRPGGPRIGRGGGAPGGGPRIKPGKFGVGNDRTAEYINRGRAAKLIEKRYGNQAARAYQNSYKNALDSGKTPTQAAIKAKADINKLFRTGKIRRFLLVKVLVLVVGTEQVDHLVVSLDEDLVKQEVVFRLKLWVVVLDFLPEDLFL